MLALLFVTKGSADLGIVEPNLLSRSANPFFLIFDLILKVICFTIVEPRPGKQEFFRMACQVFLDVQLK